MMLFSSNSFASLTEFSQPVAATLLTAIWQSALVAAGLGLCLKLAPRASAALRFFLWTAAFLTIVLLPFTSAALPSHEQAFR